MESMTAIILIGVFIVAPSVVAVVLFIDVLLKKISASTKIKRPIFRVLLKYFLWTLVLVLIGVIAALIDGSENSFVKSDVFLGSLVVGASVAFPILLSIYSSKFLLQGCNEYAKNSDKQKSGCSLYIKIYFGICIVLIILPAVGLYSVLLEGEVLPGTIVILGPSMYVMYPVFFGLAAGFLMKIHQYFLGRKEV